LDQLFAARLVPGSRLGEAKPLFPKLEPTMPKP
jgi:hypothetical protein